MEKLSSKQKNTLILLISVLAVYFFMRFFFTITLPFLLAFLIIWKVYPFLNKLTKKTKIKETWFIALFIFLIVFILICSLYVPLTNCFHNFTFLCENENLFESQFLTECAKKYNDLKDTCCEYVGEDVVSKIQSGAISSVKSCVSFVTYVVIFFVSLLLICKDFPDMKKMVEEKSDNAIIKVVTGVILYIKAFLKTQVLIFFILSVLIGVSLSILKVPNGWLFGLLAGFLDALPFIGTGIVLVPLTIWLFIKGQIWQAFVCLLLYGVCALIRELLEPKLVGKKVGIYPIVLFASVFIGMQLFGVGGIIKGPLSVVIIYELSKVVLAKAE